MYIVRWQNNATPKFDLHSINSHTVHLSRIQIRSEIHYQGIKWKLRMPPFQWCMNDYCAHSSSCLKLQIFEISGFLLSVALATSNSHLCVRATAHLNSRKISFRMMHSSLPCSKSEGVRIDWRKVKFNCYVNLNAI